MKLTILQPVLKSALTSVAGAVGKHAAAQPILGCVRLDAGAEGLVLTCTDLEMSLRRVIPTAYVSRPGQCCAPLVLLRELVDALPAELVALDLDESRLTIACGRNNARMAIVGVDQWPTRVAVEGGGVDIDGSDLAALIARVAFAASTDINTRPILAGVLWRFQQDQLVLTGADGFRLAVGSLPMVYLGDPASLIVPARTAGAVARLGSEPIQVSWQAGQVQFESGQTRLISTLIPGVYPDLSKLIPEQVADLLITDKTELLQAVRSVGLLGGNRTIRLKRVQGGLKIWAIDAEAGAAEAMVDCRGGENLRTAFYARYIQEALEALSGSEVRVSWQSETGPVRLYGGDEYTHVLMPVFVHWPECATV